MLTSLSIEHFAIVTHLELDFASGMTAFTGETGAGKSIMIDALMLALGARADASVVRKGEDKCDISASFSIDADGAPALWLQAHDLDASEGQVILRRVIYAEGRSKSWINGHPFPLSAMKTLSEMLVHIHGQHQHQTLLQHATHRQQLDAYGKHSVLLTEVANAYKAMQQIQKQIDTLQLQGQQKDKIELLQFQINELEELKIEDDEVTSLHHEHQILHHALSYLNHLQQIHRLLSSDDGPDICQGLNQIIALLNHLPDTQKQVQSAKELINNALIQCDEALTELDDFADRVQLDPERLQDVEHRMSAIHQMARKYHLPPEDLNSHLETLRQELKTLQHADEQLLVLRDEMKLAQASYTELAQQLSEARQAAAKRLSEELTTSIRQLGMPKGEMMLAITPLEKPQAHGFDKVEYLVRTNPGTEADTLAKIASGGELSRISLAIQLIAAERGATPTLFFDEVDVGIGGATAALVGQMLRQLGGRLQVFCVTHQPQVASAAHHHYVVSKHSDDTQTWSSITPVAAQDKVDEIARMLGGLHITDQTLLHAKELISQSA